MTLIVAATGRKWIWLAADRRLSRASAPPTDDGIKTLSFTDGRNEALLGYSGLGSYAQSGRPVMQPSEWMSNTLRGLACSLTEALEILRATMATELTKALRQIPIEQIPQHEVTAVVWLDGRPEIFTINWRRINQQEASTELHRLHVNQAQKLGQPRIFYSGSGNSPPYIRDSAWERILLNLIRAHDDGRVQPLVVADHIATLFARVGTPLNITPPAQGNPTVSRDCVVQWRQRATGGSYTFYVKGERRHDGPSLPRIMTGHDAAAIGKVFMSELAKNTTFETALDMNWDAIGEALTLLPKTPNSRLG